MKVKLKVKAVMVALVVLCFIEIGVSEELTFVQRMLVGLPSVGVVASIDNKEAMPGLTKEQIKTDIELRLLKAGVRVLTERESVHTKGYPLLIASVATFQMEEARGLVVYSVRLSLVENAKLQRGPYYSVETWNGHIMGRVGDKNIRSLMNEVGNLVDKFINDYLAANPKK
jgi:hypothetical protein